MPVEFDCSACQRRLRVPDEVRGQQAKCPHCEEVQWVPLEESPFAEATGSVPSASPDSGRGDNPYSDDVPIPSDNPFSAPRTHASLLSDAARRYNLASRGDRFAGFFVDWFFYIICLIPGFVFAGLSEHFASDLFSTLGGILLFAGMLAYCATQWYLITYTAQSVGKRAMRTRIIMVDGSPPGFVVGVILRNWVLGLTCLCYPIGGLLMVVDGLVIFSQNKQCLHDMIASTLVVKD